MALLIFAYFILFVISTLLSKAKQGFLYCGLFGGSFNRPIDDVIIRKLKVLGMFNQVRGEHSCGYYNGNIIDKGVDANKKWFDFVVNKGVDVNDGSNNVFIGHVRHATYGTHTEKNAHPFNIDDQLILAHNGTLSNHFELCRKYDIDTIPIFVDSHALAELVNKVGFKVLEEYKGAAALLMHKTTEPHTLYIYHGASRDLESDKLPIEERPLFIMEAVEGVYVSSLIEPLKFIREKGDDEPIRLVHNRVIPITAGKLGKARVVINREDKNIKAPVNYNSYNSYNTYGHYQGGHNAVNKALSKTNIDKLFAAEEAKGHDILKETLPSKVLKGEWKGVYYWKNRYWRDGKMLEGAVIIDKVGAVHNVIVNSSPLKEKVYYFHHGVLLDSMKMYNTLMKALGEGDRNEMCRNLTKEDHNFARYISELSRYPVVNIEGEANKITVGRDRFWSGGTIAKGAITPLWSDRTYEYKDGYLTKVSPAQGTTSGGGSKEKFFLGSGGDTNDNGGSPAGTAERSSGQAIQLPYSAPAKPNSGTDTMGDIPSIISDNYDGVSGEEVERILEKFYEIYDTLDMLDADFEGEAGLAYSGYMTDYLRAAGNIADPSDTLVVKFMREAYRTAVDEKVPLEELMDFSKTKSLIYYIYKALLIEKKEGKKKLAPRKLLK